jgi:hypothetical protein
LDQWVKITAIASGISAVMSFGTWYLGYTVSDAQLTAADRNRTFENFIVEMDTFCQAPIAGLRPAWIAMPTLYDAITAPASSSSLLSWVWEDEKIREVSIEVDDNTLRSLNAGVTLNSYTERLAQLRTAYLRFELFADEDDLEKIDPMMQRLWSLSNRFVEKKITDAFLEDLEVRRNLFGLAVNCIFQPGFVKSVARNHFKLAWYEAKRKS